MSPKSGTLASLEIFLSDIRPPMTTACWSRTTTVSLMVRLAQDGPSPSKSFDAMSEISRSISSRTIFEALM